MSRITMLRGAALAVGLSLVSLPASAGGPNELPPGASAPQAAVGDLGMSIMSAVVNADATLARGEGVTSTAGLGSGNFEVIFGRDVRACAYDASVGSSATVGTEPAGYVTVVGRAGQPNGVFLQTLDTTGTVVARGFHLIVYCGR